jgi:dihydropyrimidinase
VDYATQDKGMTLHQALDEWHKRADGTCTANYAFHMAIADWNDHTREEIADMRDAGITSFKTYFAYDHLRLDDAQTMEVLEAIKPFDGILCVHCENGTLVNELQRRVLAEGITGPEGHPLSRPAECEAEAISRLMYLSELTGARVNVVHCSTRLGLEQVRAARERGVRVSLETCPQYLLLDDTRYLEQGEDGFAGAKYVMSPPLRKPTDIVALREAVADGEVDQISTDHCSFNLHGQKDRGRGDFTKIPNGGPGVEHRPALIMTTFEGQLGPMDYLHLLSEGQARVFGMYPRKGALAAGSDADICVWDPAVRWTISAANQHQAVDYTTYEGFEAHGRAKLVFVNGTLAVRDGEPTGEKPGRYVAR